MAFKGKRGVEWKREKNTVVIKFGDDDAFMSL